VVEVMAERMAYEMVSQMDFARAVELAENSEILKGIL
jgi:hypothetical protein